MILSYTQSVAIYSAMCNLNDIGARLHTQFYHQANLISAYEDSGGFIWVSVTNDGDPFTETHESQAAFATAYNLQQG